MYIKNTFYYIIYTYYKKLIFLFYAQKSVTYVTLPDYQ